MERHLAWNSESLDIEVALPFLGQKLWRHRVPEDDNGGMQSVLEGLSLQSSSWIMDWIDSC